MQVPDFSGVNVLVVGDVMIDRYWFGDVERISPEAPVPVVAVQRTEARPGGAANVAANVTALGAACRLISVIGDDEAGRTLHDAAEGMDVYVDWVVDPASTTTVKLRVVSQNQQLLRADFEVTPCAAALDECTRRFRAALDSCDVVVVSDYGKGSLKRVEEFIGLARHAGRPIVVDPKGVGFERYAGASMITPNVREFEAVAGRSVDEADLAQRARSVIDRYGLERLLLTRSGEGMTLFYPDGAAIHDAAKAREVYDVSGAGDTVVAVVAASMGAGLDDESTLALANAAAGLVVGKLGTAVANRAEIAGVLGEESA